MLIHCLGVLSFYLVIRGLGVGCRTDRGGGVLLRACSACFPSSDHIRAWLARLVLSRLFSVLLGRWTGGGGLCMVVTCSPGDNSHGGRPRSNRRSFPLESDPETSTCLRERRKTYPQGLFTDSPSVTLRQAHPSSACVVSYACGNLADRGLVVLKTITKRSV